MMRSKAGGGGDVGSLPPNGAPEWNKQTNWRLPNGGDVFW